jgi:hypothetical protein
MPDALDPARRRMAPRSFAWSTLFDGARVFLEEGSELSRREFRMKVGRDPEEMGGVIGEHTALA